MVMIKSISISSSSSNCTNDNDCQHATTENEDDKDERLIMKQPENQQHQEQQQHNGILYSNNNSNNGSLSPQYRRHQNQNLYQQQQQQQYSSEQQPCIVQSEYVARRRKQQMFRNKENSCTIKNNTIIVSKMIQRCHNYYHHQCNTSTIRILLLLYIMLNNSNTNTVHGSIYSFFNNNKNNKRPTVRVVILAGEGNIEGFASIPHLTELINDEYKKQQQQQQSSQSKQTKKTKTIQNDNKDDNEEGSTIDVVIDDNNNNNSNKENEYNQNQFGPYSHLVDTYDNSTGRVVNWKTFDNVYVTYEHHHTTSTTSTSTSSSTATTTGTTGSTSSSSSLTTSVQPTPQQVDVLLYDTLSIMNTSTSTKLASTDTLLTGCRTCFGPEIQIGYVLQEYYNTDNDNDNNNNDNHQIPIVVVKAGWHDRSIHRDWLNGYQWYRFINTLEKTIQQLPNIIQSSSDDSKTNRKNKPRYKHPHIEYIGMVWWQGYSDMINGIYRTQYDVNLVSFIDKVRSTINQPTLPIVIVELGISGTINRLIPQMEYDIRYSQQNVCTVYQSSYVQLVSTSYIVDQYQLHTTGSNDDHPRNETQYYYGRADVLLDISYEIGITLIELNERRIEDKKYNWFHYKGTAATTQALVQNNAIDGTVSSNSNNNNNNNNDQQQQQDAEFDQVQEIRIMNSIVTVCIFLLCFVVCVIIYNYYELYYGSKSKSKSKRKRSNRNKLSTTTSAINTNNNNQLSDFVKIFRPTLSTINEDDNDDPNNDNNNDNINALNDNDSNDDDDIMEDEQLLLLKFTKKITDIELQQRAEQYGVQPQY